MRSSWSSSKSAALALALLSLAGACGGDPSGADDANFDVSGVWDAEFTGAVQRTGTTQTDGFVMELSQSGSNVSGSVRTGGSDVVLVLSGSVAGAGFDYEARGSLGPGCEAVVQARVMVDVDAAGGEFAGPQTQSTCEGTAVGSVRAQRR